MPGPRLGALLRRSPLTRRGVLVLVGASVLVAGGAWTRWWALVGIGVAALVLVAVEVVTVSGDRRLTAVRTLDPVVVPRGTPARSRVQADVPVARLPLRRAAVDHVDGLPSSVPLALGGSGGTVVAETEIPTPRRGVLPVGPLVVRTEGTLGLARLVREVGLVRQLRVLPRPVTLHALPRGTRRAATGQDERVEQGGTDLVGLHEYVPGDDLRRLHWGSSARTGTLMVREDADPALPHVLVLLDDRAGSYGADPDAFEEAVDFAAGVVGRALGDGRHVRLQTLSGSVDVDSPARPAGLTAAVDPRVGHSLAEVRLVDGRHIASVSTRDLDVAVLVTGVDVAPTDVVGVLAASAVPVVVRVDPAPERPFGVVGSVPTVDGASAPLLASAWEVVHG